MALLPGLPTFERRTRNESGHLKSQRRDSRCGVLEQVVGTARVPRAQPTAQSTRHKSQELRCGQVAVHPWPLDLLSGAVYKCAYNVLGDVPMGSR